MPPDASSWPDIGLKRTETETLLCGPPGATMTLYSLSVARCTRARPRWEAPATSSVDQRPDTVSQPSSGLVKSNPSDNAARSAADAHRPRAVPPAMSFRLDMSVIILSSCGRRGADEMSAIVETIEQELRVDGRRRSLSSFAILGAVV